MHRNKTIDVFQYYKNKYLDILYKSKEAISLHCLVCG